MTLGYTGEYGAIREGRVGIDPSVDTAPAHPTRIAVAGASGYVGQLLIRRLAASGHRIVAIARRRGHLESCEALEVVSADVGDIAATAAVLSGVETAYYLVHAMASGQGFADRERLQARAFGAAARQAGVGRIIYLGALGDEDLSAHLRSRQEVGTLLRESGVPVVELRCAVVLGAGSISFEMLRSLTERLPVMVCPRWVSTRLQPLAECDLLAYLEESLGVPPGIYELGTPDVTDYGQMMRSYAEARGLRPRRILRVPLLTPSLSSRWVDLFSPVNRQISRALVDSLISEVVVHRPEVSTTVFSVRPLTVRAAIEKAIEDERLAVSTDLFDRPEGWHGGVHTVRKAVPVPASLVDEIRSDLRRVGGDLGWYGMSWAWRLRLAMGRPFGERLGLHRPERLVAAAPVDWWTVARVDDDQLVLASANWFCGEGWLGYSVRSGPARLEQVAAFRPKGLLGLAYWRVLCPIHRVVFRRMVRHRVNRAARHSAPVSIS